MASSSFLDAFGSSYSIHRTSGNKNSPTFAFLLGRNVKGYAQQMEYQDNEPSDNPTDRADKYGKQVDGYVLSENEVSEEQEDHSDDPIDD
jgi:hypothetical protein